MNEQESVLAPSIVDASTFDDLAPRLRGPLLRPGDPLYESARRIWNGMIDRRPAAIARCTGFADVRAAVEFARSRNVPVAVRGGGHNVAGRAVCDGGLMIDLSPMKGIRLEPRNRTADAQGGVTWAEFDRECELFGLATTGGIIGATGIAGLTLGGGVGWLMGRYGMTCDNVLSVDLVTADGELRHASHDENPDLFWALRGGGGNFGVATSFRYQLHPVGLVLGGMVLHPITAARELLRFYREWTAGAPDELTAYLGFLTSPDGVPLVAVLLCHCGEIAEGERVVEPLRRFGSPVADLIQPWPYTAQQSMLEPSTLPGLHSYWKSCQLASLSDEAVDTLVAHCVRTTSPHSITLIEHHHGAMTRVPASATAFPHREPGYDVIISSRWADPAESDRHIGWAREFFEAMRPHFCGGVYVNVLSDDESHRVREAYGVNYDRLVELKTRYDSTNFFRMNQNIAVDGAARTGGG